MRKHIRIITASMLIMALLALAGCGNTNDTTSETSSSDTLVVYFSATGNTKAVAEKIASITGADIYEIKAAQEYTDEDLDWNNKDSRTTHEQNDASVRPEIGSDPVSLEGYTTIYTTIGELPPFCTQPHDLSSNVVMPPCLFPGLGFS